MEESAQIGNPCLCTELWPFPLGSLFSKLFLPCVLYDLFFFFKPTMPHKHLSMLVKFISSPFLVDSLLMGSSQDP